MADPAVLDDTELREQADEDACSLWEACAMEEGHPGVCRDMAGNTDPAEQLDEQEDAARETVRPEVVGNSPAVIERPSPTTSALDRAAEMALELPQIPGRDEFLSLAMQARIMAGSQLVPRALQNKPHDVFLVLLTGRDLGLPITTAIRKVYVIDGQISIAPLLKIGLVKRHGLGSIMPHPENRNHRDWAGAIIRDPRGNIIGETVFSWADAVESGAVRADCVPGTHSEECSQKRANKDVKQLNSNGSANYCKDNWRKNPQRMCWWRAGGFAVDDYYPEISFGLYTPDELGALTDDDGIPIDPATVSLPEGYETRRGGGSGTSAPEPASDDDKQALKVRLDALGPQHFNVDPTGPADAPTARQAILLLWQGKMADGTPRDGAEPLPPWHSLTVPQMRLATSMVKGIEDRARKGEFGEWRPPADPETGEKAPEGNSTPAAEGTGTSGEAGEAPAEENSPDPMQAIVDAVKAMNPEDVVQQLRDHDLIVPEGRAAQDLALTDILYQEAGGKPLGAAKPVPPVSPPTPPSEAPTGPAAGTAPDSTTGTPEPVQASLVTPDTDPTAIAQEVKEMKPGVVRTELARRALEITGTTDTLRLRLATAILHERVQAAEGSPPGQ